MLAPCVVIMCSVNNVSMACALQRNEYARDNSILQGNVDKQ